MGLSVLTALLGNGVAFGTALTAVYGTFGAALINLGFSALLNTAATALAGGQRQDDLARRLALPNALPLQRFVYGRTRATGSPSNFPVRGDIAAGFWLLNSRASHLPDPVIFLDKREIDWTGDPFNFAGPGASSTGGAFDDGQFRFWIGRGGQTAPPADILALMPFGSGRDSELFKSSDAMKGATILWAVCTAGKSSSLQDRWVTMPPNLEVEGDWSLICDDRVVGHNPANPATWAFRRNHALIVLDALRNNPVRQWRAGNLLIDTFTEGADICDEAVTLKSGGTEPRWLADGTIVFDGSEIEDLLAPLMLSGAADFIQTGGQLGYAWGKYRAPIVTVDALFGPALEIEDMVPGDDLANTLLVTYTAPGRGYESASLQPWAVPGAVAADGGIVRTVDMALPFCTSASQAMRARNRLGRRMRRQERLSGIELPPEALNLLAGSGVTLSLPDPLDGLSSVYEVQSIHPTADLLGDSGLALRLPAVLIKADPNEDAWVPATDQEDVVVEPYDGTRSASAIALADLREPADQGRTRYVTGWRGQDPLVTGDGVWWRDSTTGDIVTNARYVADFTGPDYQIDTANRSRSRVLTLTRASDGTYIDADGLVRTAAVDTPRVDFSDGVGALLIEPAATNLLQRSDAFDNATWIKVGGTTIAANTITGPDDGLTADTITSGNTANQGIYQSFVATPLTTYTFSYWAMLGTMLATNLRLAVWDNTNAQWIINSAAPAITLVSDEWRRVTRSFTVPAGCVSARVYPFRNGAAVPGTVHVWGAQVEAGALATSYIPTVGATGTRAADVPGVKGLTATLDVAAVYGDGTEAAFPGAAFAPGYWPALTQTRLRRLIGRTP